MYVTQSDEDKALASKYVERHQKMESERSVLESHWQEVMDYIVPRKSDVISTRSPGDKRGSELFDTTAQNSTDLLSAALHSMLTNPSTRFFDLVMGDPELDNNAEVKGWLQDVADLLFKTLNNSNFQTEVHEIYIDQCSIGTACLYMGEHDQKIVHFGARPMKEIYVDENNLGLIDTVHRAFVWKPRQVIQEFGGNNLPPEIVQQYNQGCDDPWQILHCAHPMSDGDMRSGRYGKKQFLSVYLLKDHKVILSKDGFNEFPYAVPRWTKTSGEKYGRGPGMAMLPDIKMVNAMMETIIKGAQKTIDPPLMVADDGVIGKVRLTPGGLTVVRPFSDVPIRPLITDARIDFGQNMVESIRQSIRRGFYVDQLQLREGPQMTATEVNQRTEETLRLMGPVLGRQHFEFLRPLIDRVFGIMERRGLLPPTPDAIQGRPIDVRYSSLIAKAQRASEGQMLSRAIQVAAPIINAQPETIDNLDGDAALKYVFDMNGIPQKLMRSPRDVKGIRDSRAKAQAQAAQQEQESHGAEVASKVGPAAAQMMQAQKAQ